MTTTTDIRAGEIAVEPPLARDAGVEFIGRIQTPWTTRQDTPKQGAMDGPICRIDVSKRWAPALRGIEGFETLHVLYWLHQSRRDLVLQSPRHVSEPQGTFALRSPVRPNPIGLSVVTLVGVQENVLLVRGLDCIDGTPLIDIKPDRCVHTES